MRNLIWFLILIFTTGFWSCQIIGIKKNQSPLSKKVEEKSPLQKDLDEVNQLIGFANRAKTINDTFGTDFYYQEALHKLDSLTIKYPQDSTIILKKNEITELYKSFLTEFSIGEEDTVSSLEVIEELSLINEKIDTTQIDTSTVSITDVIDETHQLEIPLVLNKKVEKTIEYFTKGKGRKVFSIWLKRSGRYEKLIKNILKESGVPEELFYLAMIESGFRPNARSWAKAVGIWQFIYGTGSMYGLKASWWFDERQDPIKSTRAAASHLKDLYERFNDWYLAMAGYNYSPGKIEKRLSKYGVNDYWDLPRLPRETRNYVPTFIAAVMITQNPEKYGFDQIEYEPSLEIDTVTVRECVDLNVVSQCINNDFTEIKNLNPALLRWCTPPDREEWILNLPKGTREIFLENYAKIPDNQKTSWVRHTIRSGETLSGISRKYGISMSEIMRFNKIRGTLIRAGSSLVIPVPQNKNYYRKYASYSPPSKSTKAAKIVKDVPGREKRIYSIKKGDTLWDIAKMFDVSVSQIKSWNGFGRSPRIYPNQKLNIWVLPNSKNSGSNTLAEKIISEESKPEISQKQITPKVSIEYTVRSGDTLWGISQSFNVSISDIKKWNGKRSNVIKPGEKLTIITSE